jgi:hypothetical protein
MLEAAITKAVVVQDEKDGKTTLMGVAEYFDDYVNFKVKYDWETLNMKGFLNDLREKLAQEFDLPVKCIDLRDRQLLGKMEQYHKWNKAAN